jgi:HEAT repeat protein
MRNIQMGRVLSRYVFTAAMALSACGTPQIEPARDATSLAQADRAKVLRLLPEVKTGNAEARAKILDMGGSAAPGLIDSMDGELCLPALKLAGELAELGEGIGVLEKAAPTFISLLSHDEWEVRESAAFTIESVSNRMPGSKLLGKAVPALIQNLSHEKSEVRKSAAWALRVVGDETAVSPLIKLLGNDEMKQSAGEALVAIGIPAVPGLVSCLSDASLSRKCARVLGEIGTPVIPEVLNSLTHDEPKVRENSAWVLGMIAEPETIPRLREVAEGDPDEKVRSAANIAILAIPQ